MLKNRKRMSGIDYDFFFIDGDKNVDLWMKRMWNEDGSGCVVPPGLKSPLRRGDNGPTIANLIKTSQNMKIYLSLIHISEPTRLGMISYAVFCLKKKTK